MGPNTSGKAARGRRSRLRLSLWEIVVLGMNLCWWNSVPVTSEGCSEIVLYQYMTPDYLKENAQMTTLREHNIHQGFLNFGRGQGKHEKLFETVLLKKDSLRAGADYVVHIRVSNRALSEDNDLHVGLSDGHNVAGFMRADAHNKYAGSCFTGSDDEGHLGSMKYGTRTGAVDYTASWFETIIYLRGTETLILASVADDISPSMLAKVHPLDRTQPFKFVAYLDDPTERIGFSAIEIIIYERSSNRLFLSGEGLRDEMQGNSSRNVVETHSGRIDFGPGRQKYEALFSIPIVGPKQLTSLTTINLRVWTEPLSKDNDLYVGISDGRNIVGWLRADQSNGHIGWPFEGSFSHNSTTMKNRKLHTSGGKSLHTSKLMELHFSLSEVTEVLGRANDQSSPVSFMATSKGLERSQPLSVVFLADDPREEYGFYGMEVAISSEGGAHASFFERLWTVSHLNKYMENPGLRSNSVLNNYLAFQKGSSPGEELFQLPFLAPKQLNDEDTFALRLSVFMEPLSKENSLIFGVTDGKNIIAFERLDEQQKRIGETWIGDLTEDHHWIAKTKGVSGGEVHYTPKYTELIVTFMATDGAVAQTSAIAVASTLSPAVKILDRTKKISVIVIGSRAQDQYGFYGIQAQVYKEGRYGVFDPAPGMPHLFGEMETRRSYFPLLLRGFKSDVKIKKMCMGSDHNLALTDTGRIYSWGRGDFGQLGLGDLHDRQLPQELTVLRGEEIVDVACGSDHSLALTKAGHVWSWGKNDFGQLGHGSLETERFPRRIDYFMIQGIECVRVIAGGDHSLALGSDSKEDGAMAVAWGRGEYGQLGTGQRLDEPYPRMVAGAGVVLEGCAGLDFTILLTKKGLMSFGRGDFGQLGQKDETTDEEYVKELVKPYTPNNRKDIILPTILEWEGETKIRGLSCGLEHVAVVTNDGDVWTWGRGDEGQLGHGKREDERQPALVDTLRSQCIRSVALGGDHSLALTEEGDVFAWGRSDVGQLGSSDVNPIDVPRKIEELDEVEVKQIFSGFDHSGVVTDGYVDPELRAKQGSGLVGMYFTDVDMQSTPVERYDPTIDLDLRGESPMFGFPSHHIAVRWTGRISSPYTEEFTFYVSSRGPAKFWLNGMRLIDYSGNTPEPVEKLAKFKMEAGVKYPMRLEVAENQGGYHARLFWSSDHVQKEILASKHLYADMKVPGSVIGDGLTGAYFPNEELAGKEKTRVDAALNFAWNGIDPPMQDIPADHFTVRWTGSLVSLHSETYTFFMKADNGARLFVHGESVIDVWKGHDPQVEASGSLAMQAGVLYPIRVEFRQQTGPANIQVWWSSPHTAKEIIPTKHMHSANNLRSDNTLPTPDGLLGTYWANRNLHGTPVGSRVDPQIDFKWGSGPPMSGMSGRDYSIRWEGQVKPPTPGEFQFCTRTDDGSRLWVNNQMVVDDWNLHAPQLNCGKVNLATASPVQIKLEYFQGGGGAQAKLIWKGPTTPFEIIPTNNLYSGSKKGQKACSMKDMSLGDEFKKKTRMNPRWTWKNEPKSWDVQSGGLVVTTERGNLWKEDTAPRIYQETCAKELDFETHMVAEMTDKVTCLVAGLAVYSPLDDDWITLKLWGKPQGYQLQWQRKLNNVVGPIQGFESPANLLTEVFLRVTKKQNRYYAYYRKQENDPWTKVEPDIEMEFKMPIQVGLFSGICDEGPTSSGATVGFEYLRDNIIPSEPYVPAREKKVGEAEPPPPGTGLIGYYFHGRNFEGAPKERTDKVIDFQWSRRHPPVDGFGPTEFSVRWVGKVRADKDETYTFNALCDDGCRLWVADEMIIDNWGLHGPIEKSGTVKMEKDKKLDLKFEYFQAGGGSTVKLTWNSPTTLVTLVPAENLYTEEPEPKQQVVAPVAKTYHYQHVGCFLDKADRAIPGVEGTVAILDGQYQARKKAVDKCFEVAKLKGFKAFALQNGGWCATGPTAHIDYGKFGQLSPDRCSYPGKGGPWANDVYLVVEDGTGQDIKSSSPAFVPPEEGKGFTQREKVQHEKDALMKESPHMLSGKPPPPESSVRNNEPHPQNGMPVSCSTKPDLDVSSTGQGVVDLQKLIHVKPTGLMNAHIIDRLKQIETERKLTVSEKVTPELWDSLCKKPAFVLPPECHSKPPLKVGDTGPSVTALQNVLDIDPADSIYGRAVAEAVKLQQRKLGMIEDGNITPGVWDVICKEAVGGMPTVEEEVAKANENVGGSPGGGLESPPKPERSSRDSPPPPGRDSINRGGSTLPPARADVLPTEAVAKKTGGNDENKSAELTQAPAPNGEPAPNGNGPGATPSLVPSAYLPQKSSRTVTD